MGSEHVQIPPRVVIDLARCLSSSMKLSQSRRRAKLATAMEETRNRLFLTRHLASFLSNLPKYTSNYLAFLGSPKISILENTCSRGITTSEALFLKRLEKCFKFMGFDGARKNLFQLPNQGLEDCWVWPYRELRRWFSIRTLKVRRGQIPPIKQQNAITVNKRYENKGWSKIWMVLYFCYLCKNHR